MLHNAFSKRLSSEPTGWRIETVTDPNQTLHIRCVPYLALLGDMREVTQQRRLIVSGSEYLARRRSWPKILLHLHDRLKGNPLVFLGTNTIADRVEDLVDNLLVTGSI